MTTTAPLSPVATSPSEGPAAAEAPDEGDGPGRLRIDPRVVQKLAAQAANEVDGVSGGWAAPIGRAIHRPVPASTPHDQLAINLDLTVSVRYPLSLPEVVERLAAHVSRRVEQLTGRPVGHVRVRIQHLGPSDAGGQHPRVR